MNELEQVVTRWTVGSRPPAVLGERVAFSGGELRLHHGSPGAIGWRARGRLRPEHRLGRGTRIELAVTSFPDRAEVTLRPVRLGRTWTATRERRFFDLAHDAASEVAAALSAPIAA